MEVYKIVYGTCNLPAKKGVNTLIIKNTGECNFKIESFMALVNCVIKQLRVDDINQIIGECTTHEFKSIVQHNTIASQYMEIDFELDEDSVVGVIFQIRENELRSVECRLKEKN